MTTPTSPTLRSDWGENPIVRLVLRNFRAFEAQPIDFAPITVFVGPNNAGKSSALSAIRILSQTLQSADPEIPLLLGEFGTFRDVVHGNNPRKTFGIRLGMRLQRKLRSFEVNFQYRAQRRQIVQQSFAADDENEQIVRTRYSLPSKDKYLSKYRDSPARKWRSSELDSFTFFRECLNFEWRRFENQTWPP